MAGNSIAQAEPVLAVIDIAMPRLLIGMPLAKACPNPLGDFKEFLGLADIKRAIGWQIRVDNICHTPRAWRHHHNFV